MTRPLTLEDFAPAPAPISDEEVDADAAARAEARLAGYEEGYASGWRDATDAASAEKARLDEEVVRNLRDLSFTYHEARVHVTAAMEALLSELLGTFFPALMDDALGHRILDMVASEAQGAGQSPLRIRAAPEHAADLRALLEQAQPVPFEIEEEPALANGQVHWAFGAVEREIDLGSVLDGVRSALSALHDINERSLRDAQ